MIELIDINKTYDKSRYVLKNLNATFETGEYIQIVGKSGSGKSTLLNLIGLLDSKYDGKIKIDGREIKSHAHIDISEIRSKHIGFIFQSYNLINNMTVLENIYLPILYSKIKYNTKFIHHVDELMEEFQMEKLRNTPIQYLSGGEKQRVSIARALSLCPDIILADEPTGNLDKDNSNIIFSTLYNLSKKGKTVILVTHNYHDNLNTDRILTLQDGELI